MVQLNAKGAFSEILPTIRHHREIAPIKRYDISVIHLYAHEIIVYNNAEYDRTVAIFYWISFSLNFVRKWENRIVRMNRLHAFEKILMNEQTVLLLARMILFNGLVISAQNYALLRRQFFPILSPTLFLQQANRLFSEHMNISVMIESDILRAISHSRLQFTVQLLYKKTKMEIELEYELCV